MYLRKARPVPFESSKIVEHYASADAVFVRDNRSSAIIDACENVYRAPDLAVQSLASKILQQPKFTRCAASPATVCVVLRKPPEWSKEKKVAYVANLKVLLQRLKNKSKVVCAVQSAVRGNDDGAFYRELGISEDLMSRRRHCQVSSALYFRALGTARSNALAGVPGTTSLRATGFGLSGMGVEEWVINGGDIKSNIIKHGVRATRCRISANA